MAEDETGTEPSAAKIDFNAPEVQAYVQKKIDSEVTGLKGKVNELLGKLKTKDERLQAFGDHDPEQVQAIFKQFSDAENAELLKQGRIGDVINKQAETAVKPYLKQLEAKDKMIELAKAEREEIERQAGDFQRLYKREVINNRAASGLEGLQDRALPIVYQTIDGWYDLDEKGTPAPTENAPLNAKGEPLPFSELRNHLIENYEFLFKQPRGGNLQLGKAGSNGARVMTRAEFRALPPAQKIEYSKSVESGKAQLID